MRVSEVLHVLFPQARFVTVDTDVATQSRTAHSCERFPESLKKYLLHLSDDKNKDKQPIFQIGNQPYYFEKKKNKIVVNPTLRIRKCVMCHKGRFHYVSAGLSRMPARYSTHYASVRYTPNA
jgi:hypothetical protein